MDKPGEKYSGESRQFAFSFEKKHEIADLNDTLTAINSITILPNDGNLIINTSAATISGANVLMVIGGGLAYTSYLISVTCLCRSGAILVGEGLVNIKP
jgi:hypothetical protein